MDHSKEISHVNPEDYENLLRKLEDINRIHYQIKEQIKSISPLIENIDYINFHLNEYEFLFNLINKKDIFKSHFEKSIAVLDTFRNWIRLTEIANLDLSRSSERVNQSLLDSRLFIENKLRLEKNLDLQ